MQGLAKEFQNDEVTIVSVHSPEFSHEKDLQLLTQAIKTHEVSFPVYVDNSREYFSRLSAQGWPSIYLVDKKGDIRFIYLGETHSGFAQANHIRRMIKTLLSQEDS